MELPHKITLFVVTGRQLGVIKIQPNKGKQAPFTRAWDEYSEGDFHIIMRLR